MIIIIESPTGNRHWRVVPVDGGMNFNVQKSQVGEKKNNGKWINCNLYYKKLPDALAAVIDRMLCDPDDKVELPFKAEDIKKAGYKVIRDRLKEWNIQIEGMTNDAGTNDNGK